MNQLSKQMLQVLAFASVIILAFQNCGKFSPNDPSSNDGGNKKLCSPNGEPYEGLTACTDRSGAPPLAMPSEQLVEDIYYPAPDEGPTSCISENRAGIQYKLVFKSSGTQPQAWQILLGRSDGFSTEALWYQDAPQSLEIKTPFADISKIQLRLYLNGTGFLITQGKNTETTFALRCEQNYPVK